MYGLTKIHKNNLPLRPVVSCIDSSTYFLAKTFNDIINQAFTDIPIMYLKFFWGQK